MNEILSAREIIRESMQFLVGDGSKIFAFEDPWCGKGVIPIPRSDSLPNVKVGNFICPDTRRWDAQKILKVFNERTTTAILDTKILPSLYQDKLC